MLPASSSFKAGKAALPVAMTGDGWRLTAGWAPPPSGWLLAEDCCLTQGHTLFLGVAHMQRLDKVRVYRSSPMPHLCNSSGPPQCGNSAGGQPCGFCCNIIINSFSLCPVLLVYLLQQGQMWKHLPNMLSSWKCPSQSLLPRKHAENFVISYNLSQIIIKMY